MEFVGVAVGVKRSPVRAVDDRYMKTLYLQGFIYKE